MPRVSLGRSVLQRPAGVGVAPWDDGVNMYIAGTDGRHVLVIDRNRMKLVHQLSTPDMLYPHGIAFSKPLREVYVTGSTSSSRDSPMLRYLKVHQILRPYIKAL
jgi:DNA-binding beta-propeller fold protein YncE